MSAALPSDALDHIVNYVEDYSDVLNVALSSKSLSSVALPHHLHYRDIRTRLHNLPLWTLLSRPDDLRSAHIRSLTILPDTGFGFYETTPNHTYDLRERLPPELTPSNLLPFTSYLDLEARRGSEASLIVALKRMSNLRRFTWYHLPRPILVEAVDDLWSTLQQLGTVRELDIFDGDVSELQVPPIPTSETFLRFSALTSLKLRTSVCAGPADPEIPHELKQMLLVNCPDLEVLVLELDLNEQIDGTANIDYLLDCARWPNLRVLRLRGVNCRTPQLTRFLTAHPRLEELALAQMMPGHAWTQLTLPTNALPRLRHLECSSPQAAALLKNSEGSSRRLETLLGIEVHETIVDSQYFSWDDDWEEEDHDNTDTEILSPWKALLLETLKAQRFITRLGVASLDGPQEMETLSLVAPQIKELNINMAHDLKIPDSEWHRLYSLFPALEVIWGGHLIWFDRSTEVQTPEMVEKTSTQLQALRRSCPNLRLVLVGRGAKKAVIIRDAGKPGSNVAMGWVIRRWVESEHPYAERGEHVYSLEVGSSTL